MTAITYFVALPFALKVDEDGELADLAPGDPVECESAEAATAMAEYLASSFLGAIAFSRSGDTDTGVFEDAVVLAKFGKIGPVD